MRNLVLFSTDVVTKNKNVLVISLPAYALKKLNVDEASFEIFQSDVVFTDTPLDAGLNVTEKFLIRPQRKLKLITKCFKGRKVMNIRGGYHKLESDQVLGRPVTIKELIKLFSRDTASNNKSNPFKEDDKPSSVNECIKSITKNKKRTGMSLRGSSIYGARIAHYKREKKKYYEKVNKNNYLNQTLKEIEAQRNSNEANKK